MPSTPQAVDSGAAPRRMQSLLIRGGGAPDVHVSLVAERGQSPTPAVAEAGGSAPERAGERIATVDATHRNGAAPKSAGSKHAAPEQGSKRVAPDQGSSNRPANKPRVRSKM
jgi:hypothetical protein